MKGKIMIRSKGHPQVCIAVLDGPADLSHPCFSQAHRITHSSRGASNPETMGPSIHGTHVASILFGQPGSPVEGIVPSCRGLLIPIFPTDESGGLSPCSQAELAAAIVEAVEQGAHVINISGGELVYSKLIDPSLESAIELCSARNVLIVAAAGNNGCDCTHIPAGFSQVLAVGAVDRRGDPLPLSNWGEPLRRHGIMAPGEAIPGAIPGGGVARLTGTSFATPIVSGFAALLLSLQVHRGEQPDPLGVREAILASAIPCNPVKAADCRRLLSGRLNVVGALQHLTARGGQNRMFESEELYASGDTTERAVPAISGSVPSEGEIPPTQDVYAPSPTPFSFLQGGLESTFAGEVTPSCACGGETPYLVLPIGKLTYDFGSDARLESFRNLMFEKGKNDNPNPWDHKQMVWYLQEKQPEAASHLIWVLSIESMPKFAIAPNDAYAQKTLELLRAILAGQLEQDPKKRVERVSLPGVAQGKVRLYSGQEVPIVRPDLRGIYAWSIKSLIQHLQEHDDLDAAAPPPTYTPEDFLNRLYYESINDGISGPHRAFNIAITRAAGIYKNATDGGKLVLNNITVEKSRFTRPGSDCWEVTLFFFDPKEALNRSKKAVRFTYDVADTVPAPVGPVRIWPTV